MHVNRALGSVIAVALAIPLSLTAIGSASARAWAGLEVTGRHATTQASTRIKLSAATGPPTSMVRVSGTGFGAHQAVDIYFDTRDEALAATNAKGSFSDIPVVVPASAVPGSHYITAVERHSGRSAQAAFTVRANWPQFRNGPKRRGDNTTENVLGPANVSRIDLDWSYATGYFVGLSSPAVANGVVYIG